MTTISHHPNGSARAPDGRTSFSQLVRAHHRWAKQLHGRTKIDQETHEQYQAALADFEETAGTIVDAYWCLDEASAVALTAREPVPRAAAGFLGRLIRRESEPELRLHRVTDWVTASASPLADLLHGCDILGIKAGEGLEGTAQRVAMHWVLAVETHVLGFVERSHANHVTLKEMQAFVASERAELKQIEAYINGSGGRQARIYYIQGMLFGIGPLIALGFLAAFLISLFDALDVHDETVRAFYGCFAAGAAGAIVSVLSRMGSKTDNFAIDHEIPRRGALSARFVPTNGRRHLRCRDVLSRLDRPAPDRHDDEELCLLRHGLLPRRLQRQRWTRVILDGAQNVIGADRHSPADQHSPEVNGSPRSA